MIEVTLDLELWDDTLAIRLPAAVANAASLRVDQRIDLSVQDGVIIIKLAADGQLSLEERLALYAPARHGATRYLS